jgi:acyl-CoA synthetase (AMP-forming)/AMP-acid ligase II
MGLLRELGDELLEVVDDLVDLEQEIGAAGGTAAAVVMDVTDTASVAAAFDARGFLRTGDIGRFDDHGHLYITGRLKEMMIVAGENVFPREIEDVLMAHPSVEAAGVTSVQDPTRGELPIAFVQMREGQPFDQAVLMQFCRDKLAGYKVPREVRCVEALPRNPTGKVMRRELKALI